VTFLVDNRLLKSRDDIKCNDRGAWKHTGSLTKWFFAKREENKVVTNIVPLHRKPENYIYIARLNKLPWNGFSTFKPKAIGPLPPTERPVVLDESVSCGWRQNSMTP